MKKLLLILMLAFSLSSFGQNGWRYGYHYEQRGQTWTETRWFNGMQYYRRVIWHQTRGYYQVYYWQYDPWSHRYYWRTQWRNGWSWYYTWSRWYLTGGW